MANTTTFVPHGLYMQPPLRYKIRELLLLHSAEEIYTTLQSIFNEDYQFYQSLFTAPAAPAPAPAPAPVPEPVPESVAQVPEEPVPAAEAPVLRASTKIRIVKKPAPNPLPENHEPQEGHEHPVLHPTTIPIVTEVATERDRKMQIKKEQNEKVAAKFEELQSKGIDSYSLLTKDNLKRWVDTERLTYTQIGRDHVGIAADEIAAIAKGFGIQSHIAKKRAIIIAGKK